MISLLGLQWLGLRIVRLLPVLLLFVSLMSAAWGQTTTVQSDSMTVAPGERVSLATLSTKPEGLKTTLGSLDLKISDADPRTFEIIFTAPVDSEGKTAQITYTVNQQSRGVSVAIGSAGPWGAAYAPAFKVLFALFVLAVVLEWGLAVLFNWRWFLEIFEAKGLKTLISVMFAYWVVAQYDLDLMTRLVNILWGTKHSPDYVSRFISALVLAGGSSGVNTMLVALGFRSVRTAEAVQPKPPLTKAWVSITAVRSESVGPLALWMSTDNGANYFLIQQFNNAWKAERPWYGFILRNPGRWPRFGGYTLDPGTSYAFEIRECKSGKVFQKWGPHALSAGAVIDIVLTV